MIPQAITGWNVGDKTAKQQATKGHVHVLEENSERSHLNQRESGTYGRAAR